VIEEKGERESVCVREREQGAQTFEQKKQVIVVAKEKTSKNTHTHAPPLL